MSDDNWRIDMCGPWGGLKSKFIMWNSKLIYCDYFVFFYGNSLFLLKSIVYLQYNNSTVLNMYIFFMTESVTCMESACIKSAVKSVSLYLCRSMEYNGKQGGV